MSFEQHDGDSEFVKLMMRRADIDLTAAALELARDAWPDLDFQPTLDWIASRGQALIGSVARAKDERNALLELGRCLAETHGITGDETAYERADGSYLHRVIETGQGIPISLTVLYMAVGRTVGLDLQGVSAPRHFLARYESVDGPLYLDAFSGGRVLTEKECLRWLQDISQLPPSDIRPTLKPVGPRAIIVRMLNNLKALHVRQEAWQAAWAVQNRLTSLQPTVYQERRDLALLSLRANRPGQAFDLLGGCLKGCPREDADLLKLSLAEAERQLARWN